MNVCGNLTLVPAYFNPVRGRSSYLKDYWDLSLDYLKNNGFRKVNYPKDLKSMSKENFKVYINTFFLWDYVKANDDEYIVRSLCEGKLENHISFDKAEDDVERFKTFLENVCGCIRRRSLFMTAMLWLKDCHRDLYEDLIRKISDDRVMSGYDLVFKCLLGEDSSIEVDKKLVDKLTDGDRELLRGTWRRINEIKVYQ